MAFSHYSPVEHEDSNSSNVATNSATESGVNLRGRLVTVTLFATCVVLLFADQNLMAPNLSAIATEFGFNDEERDRKLGGQIALAFFVMGAPASLLIGCLGDQCNRIALFALTVGLGETACLLTYFSSDFTQLFLCRAVTGLSLGGAIPLIYSILGDLFAAEDRHAVNAVVSMGSGFGIAIGQGTAGFMGPSFGWRLPFLVVSIPALVCALAVFCFVKDPERGGMEPAIRAQKKHESDEMTNRPADEMKGSIELTEMTRKRGSNSETHGEALDELHLDDHRTPLGSSKDV
jgi:MFS family permease